MQPTRLVEWLRQIHLTADANLASKRWKLAENFIERIDAKAAAQLLRIFLFPQVASQQSQTLTDQLLEIDNEFPASDNAEDIRLLAGLSMLAAVSKREALADAFALGVVAASFPKHRSDPAQRGIVEELGKYLHNKANSLRPSDFDTSAEKDRIQRQLEVLATEIAKPTNLKAAIGYLTDELDRAYGLRLQRLSEECGLLWWLLGGYSTQLNRETSVVEEDAYALVAASEVASRTLLLPPPPSIVAVLKRALEPCKKPKKRKLTLKDILGASDAAWRTGQAVSHPGNDFADLIPLLTALAKLEESGDITVLDKVLPKSCPGVSTSLELTPSEASHQFYNELLFCRALTQI